MTDGEDEKATTAKTGAGRDGTTGAGTTAADTTETQTTTGISPDGSTTIVEVTLGETTSIATATAATTTVTSAGGARRGAQRLLDAPVRTPAPGLALHLRPRRPKTRQNPTLLRRVCLPPPRTRSRMRTGRALYSNTTSRPRLVSPSSGGGCMFSKVASKSVRAFSLSLPLR